MATLRAFCALSVFAWGSAHAANLVVTSELDSHVDNVVNLREAINQSNVNGEDDVISFQEGITEILLATPLPIVNEPGFTFTINGGGVVTLNGTNFTSIGTERPGMRINAPDATIQGLHFTSFRAATGIGLHLQQDADSALVTQCQFTNCDQGLLTAADGAEITDCIWDSNQTGIRIDGAQNVVTASTFDGNEGGVTVSGSFNTIGGGNAGERNTFINNSTAIALHPLTTPIGEGNRVVGNNIGRDEDGNVGRNNNSIASQLPHTTIGGPGSGDGNEIVGAGGGIGVGGTGSKVEGNCIGITREGSTLHRNSGRGISSSGEGIEILGNFISGNIEGVVVEGGSVVIRGNFIGVDLTGMLPAPNEADGIRILDGINVLIGGAGAGQGNVISANGTASVTDCCFGGIFVDETDGVVIQGNTIGLAADGQTPLANAGFGVMLQFSNGCIIGGSAAGEGNVVSGNGNGGLAASGDGIRLSGSNACSIRGNVVGASADVTQYAGNRGNGISIIGGTGNAVGGENPGDGNVVSANNEHGIALFSTTGNTILGNRVGTGLDSSALGNAATGILLDGSANNQIGGPGNEANIVANNQGHGVAMSFLSHSNPVRFNSIHDNGGSAISNANGTQGGIAPPVITSTLPPAGTAAYDGIIDLYADDENEARIHVAAVDATGGTWSALALPEAYAGMQLTATLTDATGNTSMLGIPAAIEIVEGEGEIPAVHTADINANGSIEIAELLRVIQLYNAGGIHCDGDSEDGYAPGAGGNIDCEWHDTDENQDWSVNLSELLGLIQMFNLGGYHLCEESPGFCPGPAG